MKTRSILVLVMCLFTSACGGDPLPSVKTYPDSVDGLKSLMTDFSAAADEADTAAAMSIGERLLLSDASAWFTKYFGQEKAADLSAEYAASAKNAPTGFVEMLKAQKAKGRTEFIVDRFDKPLDPNACGFQQAVLEAAKSPLVIYSWRAVEPGKSTGQHLYNFVHIDGQWKFVGPMKALKPELAKDPKMNAVSSLRAKDREEFFKSGKLPE